MSFFSRSVITWLFFSVPTTTLMVASSISVIVMGFQAAAGCQQGRLVQQVFEIRAGEAGRRFGDGAQIHIRRNRLAARMHLQISSRPFTSG